MAFTTENANLTRQRTYMITRTPGIFFALKALFLHLASNKGNPDLKLYNIDGTNIASDGGATANQVAADAANTLYAIYLIKKGTVATFFKATNNASTATTDGTEDLSYKVTTANEEDIFLFPTGRAFGTGLTVTENTTATGSTAPLKANRIDGFIIMSA